MKSKFKIIQYIDSQPWKNEFYENVFKYGSGEPIYNDYLISSSFIYKDTPQGQVIWEKRNEEYQKWYNSIDKPMSWEEYCEQNPIQEGDYFINNYSIVVPSYIKKRALDTDVNIMSKELCEAFVAYMKLIQLRNAWIKVKGNYMSYKITATSDKPLVHCVSYDAAGISFPDKNTAQQFLDTFKDLLEIAKPLL